MTKITSRRNTTSDKPIFSKSISKEKRRFGDKGDKSENPKVLQENGTTTENLKFAFGKRRLMLTKTKKKNELTRKNSGFNFLTLEKENKRIPFLTSTKVTQKKRTIDYKPFKFTKLEDNIEERKKSIQEKCVKLAGKLDMKGELNLDLSRILSLSPSFGKGNSRSNSPFIRELGFNNMGVIKEEKEDTSSTFRWDFVKKSTNSSNRRFLKLKERFNRGLEIMNGNSNKHEELSSSYDYTLRKRNSSLPGFGFDVFYKIKEEEENEEKKRYKNVKIFSHGERAQRSQSLIKNISYNDNRRGFNYQLSFGKSSSSYFPKLQEFQKKDIIEKDEDFDFFDLTLREEEDTHVVKELFD